MRFLSFQLLKTTERNNLIMKNLPTLFLLISSAFMLGCNNGSSQGNPAYQETQGSLEAPGSQDAGSIAQLFEQSMQGVEPTKYEEVIDQKNGLVQARYPIPKSWRVNGTNNPVYIQGPNNLQVYKATTESLVWSNDPMMQQTLQMSGKQLGQPMTNQQLLNQIVKPNAETQGYRFVRSFELPEVSGFWQRFFNAMPNTGSRRTVEALGTEWNTDKGTKSLIVMVRQQIQNQQLISWTIQTTELEAEPGSFDQAKNAYLYSIANAQINPQWIQYMNNQLVGNIQKNNQFWAQASAQSAAAHQQRMQAIAARGNTAASIGNTYSDILDISHKGYLNRSNINDKGHASTVRAIHETTLIGNHETRERYNVPAGSKYYWVANDGTYVGTDNALFDPNIIRKMNDRNWTKFAVED